MCVCVRVCVCACVCVQIASGSHTHIRAQLAHAQRRQHKPEVCSESPAAPVNKLRLGVVLEELHAPRGQGREGRQQRGALVAGLQLLIQRAELLQTKRMRASTVSHTQRMNSADGVNMRLLLRGYRQHPSGARSGQGKREGV